MTRMTMGIAVLAITLASPSIVDAHTAWLEEDPATPGVYRVLFGGHAGQLETLVPAKIESVSAFNGKGEVLAVSREDGTSGSRLTVPAAAALLAMSYDNGIWSKDAMGRSVNLPMTQVKGAREATWAPKFHKTVVSWEPVVSEPIGQTFEVVPMDSQQPVAGEPMRVRVLVDGKPAEGVRLGHGEKGDGDTTDAEGVADFVPRGGFNRLWAGLRTAVEENEYTELSYEYLLCFVAQPAS